jgi:endonuclease III
VDSGIKSLKKIRTYSEELSLDLRRPEDRFKWFLASILFAKRISAEIAKKTFKRFEEEGLVTPQAILKAGWDRLVQVLDSGGYVRYDFSTASNLMDISKNLLEKFGSLEEIHDKAESSRHLEELLLQFKGIGPVCVNIFLRELRGIWKKANPKPSKLATEVAEKLGVKKVEEVESQLVKINLEYCKKEKCSVCPVNRICRRGIDRI